jgi:hypothetical protein
MSDLYLNRSNGNKQHVYVQTSDTKADGTVRLSYMACCTCPGTNNGTTQARGTMYLAVAGQARNVCKHGGRILAAAGL